MVLAVPAAVFGREVVNEIEAMLAEDRVHLLELADVRSEEVGIFVVNDVGGPHLVTAAAKLAG